MSPTGPNTPLERLLLEVRAQRPPEPREHALPARLRDEFRSFAAQPRSTLRRTRRARFASWPLVAAAALAAAGALLALRSTAPEPAGPGRASPPLASADGEPLEVGVPLVALAAPRLVQHADRASWLLQPGSRASLRSSGPVVRVDLEEGGLTAQVRPSTRPESFVVQARGTEVAVRGTRFSVSVQGERVHVQVLEGSVWVRPVGGSSGTVLSEGARSEFLAGVLLPIRGSSAPGAALALDAAEEAAQGVPAAPGQSGRIAPRPASGPEQQDEAPHASAREPAAAAPPPAAVTPSRAEMARDVQLVSEHVRDCFRRELPGSTDLGVEVSTHLALWVEASGKVLRADFDPPLAPDIESCVASELVQFRATPSPDGYRVERALLLRR